MYLKYTGQYVNNAAHVVAFTDTRESNIQICDWCRHLWCFFFLEIIFQNEKKSR